LSIPDVATEKMRERWQRTEEIFHEAVGLAEPERTRLLEQRCGDDTVLMAELRSLLDASEQEELQSSARAAEARQAADEKQRVGPYVIDHLLGRGGMGAVYLAHRDDGQFEQQVAIKVIGMAMVTDMFRERFRTERQILADLSHPYIARLLDGGVSDQGEPYLAMEYIEGVSITKYSDQQHLSIAQRLELFQKVCEAVQYAHQNLIVHRDIKPDNILVTADGTPRLLDFGTAKIVSPAMTGVESEFTRVGLQTFTPRYASPEQVLGHAIGTTSDVYSLGVLLFRLLTGSLPYELVEFSTAEMVRVICQEEPKRPTSTTQPFGKLDADLDAIVLKSLRKEPQQRYSTVEQMASDVRAYLEQRPVSARRGNFRYRASKFVRRNRLAIIGASLLMLSILAGMAGILWQSRSANLERRRAETRAEDLRQLSNSLLSEIDNAISDLPGSTPAQHLLVTRVVEHLDRMAKDTDGNRQTQLDIANGYQQLGNIQGNGYTQNIGDISGALVNLNKALKIARALVQANPKDKAARQLEGGVLHDLGATDTSPQNSAAYTREAIEVHKKILTEFGDTEAANRALSADYAILADDYFDYLKQSVDALKAARMSNQYLKRAMQLASNDKTHPLSLIMNLHKLGKLETYFDPYASLRDLQEGVDLWNALSKEPKEGSAGRRAHQVLQTDLGETYSMIFDRENSQRALQTALAIVEKEAQQNPKDTRAQFDLYAVYNMIASCSEDDTDPRIVVDKAVRARASASSLDLEERGLMILDALMKSGPTDTYYRMNYLDAQLHIARVKRAQGKTAEAIALEAKYIPAMKAMSSDPDLLSDTYYDLADALATASGPLRDVKAAVDYASRAVEMSHRQDPVVLLKLAEASRANQQLDRAHAAAREGLALLAPFQAGHKPTRLVKLLQWEIEH